MMLKNLSSAAIFVEATSFEWVNHEDVVEIVLPDPFYFLVNTDKEMLPQVRPSDPEDWPGCIQAFFERTDDYFMPTENYFFDLPALEMSPREAQAHLYYLQNPCFIVLVQGKPTLTAPGCQWKFSDVIARAYLVLGYIPPFILQEGGEWSPFIQLKALLERYLQTHLNAIEEEYDLLLRP